MNQLRLVHSVIELWLVRFILRSVFPFTLWSITGSTLVGCAHENYFEKKKENSASQSDGEKNPESTLGQVKPRKQTEANFGAVPAPSNPSLETRIALSITVADESDASAAGYSLSPSDTIMASYSVVGCTSGYAPTGTFTNSGTRVLYRNDSGCAVALASFTFNGTSYALRDGTFLTAQGSSNAFVSQSSSTIIAINIKTQLNTTLGAAGELAEFTAHLVTPGANQNLNGFLIVTTMATSSSVAENGGAATFNLQVLGTSTVTTTVYYTLSGTADAGDDYIPMSGTVDIAPGATSVPLTVTLINDSALEIDETLILTLEKNRPNYFPVESNPTITITDDD